MKNTPSVDTTISAHDAVKQSASLARALARRFAGQGVDLDDLEQEALIAVFRAASVWRNEGAAFASFAHRCIVNRLLNVVRYARHRAALSLDEEREDGGATLHDVVGWPETQAKTLALGDAVERLSSNERQVFLLRAEGYTLDEIRNRLGLSSVSVAQLRAARAAAVIDEEAA